MKTLGWIDIEQMFYDEIILAKSDIRTNNLDYKTIAVHTIARKEAGKIVKKVLARLNAIANEISVDKQSYK